MKKLIRYLKIAWYALFYSMRSADKMLATSNQSDDLDANDLGGIEQQQEKQSVYKDLLKGVVTEQVRELRHEMYFAERKSHEYEYAGGGRVKKTGMFDYKGNVERSDGYKILIVQENRIIPKSLTESGVVVYGEKSDVDQKLSELSIRNNPESEKEHLIKFDRDFFSRFQIENYLSKIVIKEVENDVVMIDFYVTKYIDKLKPTSKLFHTEMEMIYQGFVDSDVLRFNRVHFVAYKAYGVPDLTELSFVDFKFDNIVDFDGSYVLKFYAKKESKTDLIMEFYNENTAKKCENHEAREGATIDFETAWMEKNKKQYDAESAEKLIEAMTNNEPNTI